MKILHMTQNDINQVSELHFNELNDGFLVLFGKEFIQKMYSNLLKNDNWGFVCKKENEIIGFIFAKRNDVSKLGILNAKFLCLFIFNLITKPHHILNIISFFKNKSKKFYEFTKLVNAIELSAFVVKESYKSKGIGKNLEKHFSKKAAKDFMYAYTVTHNKRLHNYYMKNKKIEKMLEVNMPCQSRFYSAWKLQI